MVFGGHEGTYSEIWEGWVPKHMSVVANQIQKFWSYMNRILVMVNSLERRSYVKMIQEAVRDDVPDSQQMSRLFL